MKRAVVFFASVVVAGTAFGAQPIGRLFFTPLERAQLDVARTQKQPPPQLASVEPVPPPPSAQTVTYGGIVRRSDGKSMLWINNRLVDEKEALAGLNIRGRVRPDGAVTLQVPQTGATIDVKVGQSVEVLTGKVAETRKPQAEAPPASDAKPAAEGKPPAAEAQQAVPSKPEAEPAQKSEPASVGLKMDLGGRRLAPQEESALRSSRDTK